MNLYIDASRNSIPEPLAQFEQELAQAADPRAVLEDYRRRYPELAETLGKLAEAMAMLQASPLRHASQNEAEPGPADPDVTLTYLVGRDHGRVGFWIDANQQRRLHDAFAPGGVLQGRYQIDQELGRGGMGVVFLGRDLRLNRPVAIKASLLLGRSRGLNESDLASLRSAFAEEARLGANLTHPSIATVYDYGFHDDKPFTVFEYLPGETLRELLGRRGRLPLDEVRLIIGSLAQALDFAHGRRVVHRDLKPGNVRATEQGLFKVLDLGLAREFGRDVDWSGFAGTPAYASPEQASGLPCDGRADQYALALIAFELLAGHRLFLSRDPQALLVMHREVEPAERLATDLVDAPDTVRLALSRAFCKDPNARFDTCADFAVALGCLILSSPAPAPEILVEADIERMTIGRFNRRGGLPFFGRAVHLTLTREDLWVAYKGELRRWPLKDVSRVEPRVTSVVEWERIALDGETVFRRTLWLSFSRRTNAPSRISFLFPSVRECAQWARRLTALIAQVRDPDEVGTEAEDEAPAPVVLLRQRPPARYQVLGLVEAKGEKRERAEGSLQVRAAMMGADAVLDLQEEILPDFHRSVRRLTGTAVRAVDAEGRFEFRSRWYAATVARISGSALKMLLVIFPLTILSSLVWSFLLSFSNPHAPLAYLLLGIVVSFLIAIVFWAWPIALAVSVRCLRWPQLVRPLCLTLVAFALRPVFLLTGLIAGAVLAGGWSGLMFHFLLLLDPGNLSIMVFGLFLGRAAGRADREFRRLTQGADRKSPLIRTFGGSLAWTNSIVYAISLGCFYIFGGYINGSQFQLSTTINQLSTRINQKLQILNENEFRLVTGSYLTNPSLPEEDYRTIVDAYESVVRADPSNPDFTTMLAFTRIELAAKLVTLNRIDEARVELDKSSSLLEALPAGQLPQAKRELVDAVRCALFLGHGLAQRKVGDDTRAQIDYRNALEALTSSSPSGSRRFLRYKGEATVRNGLAWLLLMTPDRKPDQIREAVTLAESAATLDPTNGANWRTLALARYRVGELPGAFSAIDRSMRQSRGGDANDWVVLAMICWGQGERAEARRLHDQVASQIEHQNCLDEDLRQLFDEASALLVMPQSDRDAPVSR